MPAEGRGERNRLILFEWNRRERALYETRVVERLISGARPPRCAGAIPGASRRACAGSRRPLYEMRERGGTSSSLPTGLPFAPGRALWILPVRVGRPGGRTCHEMARVLPSLYVLPSALRSKQVPIQLPPRPRLRGLRPQSGVALPGRSVARPPGRVGERPCGRSREEGFSQAVWVIPVWGRSPAAEAKLPPEGTSPWIDIPLSVWGAKVDVREMCREMPQVG